MTKRNFVSNKQRRINTEELAVLDLIDTSSRSLRDIESAKNSELLRLRREVIRLRKNVSRLSNQRDSLATRLKSARALITQWRKTKKTNATLRSIDEKINSRQTLSV